MKVYSIEWHKKNIINTLSYTNRLRKSIRGQIKELKNLEKRLIFYNSQIKEAEKRGKNQFDPDKFLVKKNIIGEGIKNEAKINKKMVKKK